MALKFVNKSKTKLKNFLREFSITNTLSSSPFIIKVFDVVFETEECYVFAQEYAPGGDLFDIIPPQVPAGEPREVLFVLSLSLPPPGAISGPALLRPMGRIYHCPHLPCLLSFTQGCSCPRIPPPATLRARSKRQIHPHVSWQTKEAQVWQLLGRETSCYPHLGVPWSGFLLCGDTLTWAR